MSEKIPTNFERVIGGNDEDKERIMGELEEAANYLGSHYFSKYEVEKTPNEIEMIKQVDDAVSQMVREYDGSPLETPIAKVHIVSSVSKASKKSFGGGWHSPIGQYIVVERQADFGLQFLRSLVHEFFHKKSYKSAQVAPNRGFLSKVFNRRVELDLYRSGLSMVDRKRSSRSKNNAKEYFGDLEEAIVAEMTQKYFRKHIESDPRYAQQYSDTVRLKLKLQSLLDKASPGDFPDDAKETLKQRLEDLIFIKDASEIFAEIERTDIDDAYRLGFILGSLSRMSQENTLIQFERREERDKMYALFDRLVIASKQGEFPSRAAAFDDFARANFSGNLLPLARKVEAVLGEGSFRGLAEEFSRGLVHEGDVS
jgi:hypothetical protein